MRKRKSKRNGKRKSKVSDLGVAYDSVFNTEKQKEEEKEKRKEKEKEQEKEKGDRERER